MVVLDAGATATLVCCRRLDHHRLLERNGLQRVTAYPSKARFLSRGERLGEVRRAADIPAGIAGAQGVFTACVLDANIPALLRESAAEALGGQLDFSRDLVVLLQQTVAISLRVNRMGRYFLRVVDFVVDSSRKVWVPVAPAFFFEIAKKSPAMSDGDPHFLYTMDGLYEFEPPAPLRSAMRFP